MELELTHEDVESLKQILQRRQRILTELNREVREKTEAREATGDGFKQLLQRRRALRVEFLSVLKQYCYFCEELKDLRYPSEQSFQALGLSAQSRFRPNYSC